MSLSHSLTELFHSVDHLDLQEVKHYLQNFNLEFLEAEDYETLCNKLKKYLLREILKLPEINREYYESCLASVNVSLNIRSASVIGYPCELLGCRFFGKRHKDYVGHLKRCHPTLDSVMCNFKKSCKRKFTSIENLFLHLREEHVVDKRNDQPLKMVSPDVANIPCKCDRVSCGGFKFASLQLLMKHYNSFHSNEERKCIFEGCKTVFHSSCPTSAMNHFKRHKEQNKLSLQSKYLVYTSHPIVIDSNISYESPSTQHNDIESTAADQSVDYTEEVIENMLAEDVGIDENDVEYYQLYYSHFLNRLSTFNFIPQTTIQEIVNEYIMNTRKSIERQKRCLSKALSEVGVSSKDSISIIDRTLENDPFLEAQLRLNSEYKRLKHVQEQDTFIAPTEVILNPEKSRMGETKDKYHYISILESFKCLVQDPSFLKVVSGSSSSSSNSKLNDLKDGIIYKNNEYFMTNKDAYSMILYSDGVEIKNPLGAARGVYKVVLVYYTLCEIKKSQRSQIDRLHLVMVFREKLLKKYSLKMIMKPLVRDLKSLEIGVQVFKPMPKILKCGVLCYVADNLEASVIGGFSCNFSSKDICRVCHIQHCQLKDQINDYHGYWTIQEYNTICANFSDTENNHNFDLNLVESDSDHDELPDISDTDEDETDLPTETIDFRGLKHECPFNSLSSFHAVTSFPLDLMHDILEGRC